MQPELSAISPSDVREDVTELLVQKLRAEIGERNFRHWFENRSVITFDGQTAQISVSSPFLQSWMQRRFGRTVMTIAHSLASQADVSWTVDESLGSASVDGERAASHSDVSAEAASLPAVPRGMLPFPVLVAASSSEVAPKAHASTTAPRKQRRFMSLADFVSGPCNELALTAARQVCIAPGERLSSLYLHGSVGTGKTHLIEGIYQEIRRQHPQLQILFMTAEDFGNRFTHALRTQALPGFRQRFRNVDVLIVDDVSFLDGKQAMQEEFLHTFKQIVSHGGQVVVTSDCHPRLLKRVSDELVTRLLCGMVCRIETPDLETRRKIAQSKCVELNAQIASEALDYVARRFVHSVREIEGALNTLRAWQHMTGRKVSLTVARQALSELERDCIRVVRLADIERAVCDLFGVTDDDLKGARRTRSVSQPRMLAMFLARRHTQAAYKEIGEFFGGRNHSTVVAAEKKIDTWLRSETEMQVGGRRWNLSDIVERLEQQILAG
ncbi:chromosomal replication initiator protein DnaA [bacterium]|nr:chromosomal replication initiator protein DnaA [bacterium]